MASPIFKVTNFLGITNTKSKEAALPDKPIFDLEKEGEKKILLEWDSDARRHEKLSFDSAKNKNLLIIGVVVSLLLVAMQEFLLIIVAASIIFLKYILSSTLPEIIHHELSNHGVNYAGQFYGWGELKKFFFKKEGDTVTLCIDTKDKLPGRLFLLLNNVDKSQAKEVVGKYLPYLDEEPKSMMDKMYESAVGKISIEG